MRASHPGSLAEVVTDLNRSLANDLGDVERFMTFYLIEIRDDGLTWVSAGHEPAILLDPASGVFSDLEGDGPVLGIDTDLSYREHQGTLFGTGQILALCTDGITEAWNTEGAQFGRDRFKQSLQKHAALPAKGILDAVMADVLAFQGTASQVDDLTLVVVKRTAEG